MPSPSEPGLLLAIDGDSLAHRAYHALPKTIKRAGGRPGGALVGFGNFLLRLWDAEQPAAVVVALGHARRCRTTATRLLPGYQAGRVFDDPLLEQLDLLPGLVESFGFVVGEGRRVRGRRLPRRGGGALARAGASSPRDRDAFQLVSDRVTVLQPVKGERARPGRARRRCASATASSPAQVPDFIALRGDSSDRIPGAPGVGPKTAADGARASTARSRRRSRPGGSRRSPTTCGSTGGSRRWTPAAPLPELRETPPDWARAEAAARELGLNALARRIAERA